MNEKTIWLLVIFCVLLILSGFVLFVSASGNIFLINGNYGSYFPIFALQNYIDTPHWLESHFMGILGAGLIFLFIPCSLMVIRLVDFIEQNDNKEKDLRGVKY